MYDYKSVMKKNIVEVMLLGSSISGKGKIISSQREKDYYVKLGNT